MRARRLTLTKAFAAVLVISVVLRIGLGFVLGGTIEEVRGGTYDQVSYDALAQRVAAGFGFSFAENSWPSTKADQPTAHWSYLYTLFLAGIYSAAGHQVLIARLIQAILVGILTPWLLYRIGKRTFNRRVGLIAAAGSAIYAYFILYASSLMTEAFYIVSLLWTLDAAMRVANNDSQKNAKRQCSYRF